MTFGSLLRILK